MFKLIQLELENFLCFREKQSIDFTEINFPLLVLGENRNEFVKDSQKIIFGSNGAGKTSFFTAIVFALFNFSEKFNLDNLINNVSKKNLIVRLVFEKNEKTYTIFKFRKHKEFKNSTFLLEGNVDYKQLVEKYNSESMNMSSNEVETIKQLIGFDEKIFFQTIFFSQKKLTNFFEKSKNERYKIFELILENLEIFNQIKESAKELYKDSENEVEKLDFVYNDRENKLLNIEKELNEKEKEFAEKKKEFNEKEKEIKEKIKNLITEEKYKTILEEYEKFLITKNDIKNKLTEEETNETTYKNETDEIKNELEIYNDFDKKEYEEITKKINDIRNELIALDNEYTIKNSEYEKENTETSIFFNKIENEKINVNNLLKQLEKLNKDKEKFVEAVDTINKNQKAICPVCKQEITNKH